LEAQQQKRRNLQTLARATSLDALANAQSAPELKAAWGRVQEHLPLYLDGPEEIWEIKQTIINLAMSGFLIEESERSKKTGHDLLKAIDKKRKEWASKVSDQELKEAQTMQKKLKRQKLLKPERSIPANWTWGTFLQISQAVVDCHNKTAPYVSDGIHLVRTTNIRKGIMDLRNTKKITKETYDYWARRMPPKPGDVFFTREAPMGEAAIVPEGGMVCLGQRTMLIRLFHDLFDKHFLIYAVYSPSFIKRMSRSGIGATVQHLRVGTAEDLLVPVPPIEEQRIIVKRLDGLMKICDQLERQLTKAKRTSERLVVATIAAITGTQTKETQTMKAPQTELVTKLQLKTSPKNKDLAPLSAILAKNNGELSAKALYSYAGLEIDGFYQQLKTEMAQGWIIEPEKARVIEKAVSPDGVEVA
jgi:type I restriction enzyme S subunit